MHAYTYQLTKRWMHAMPIKRGHYSSQIFFLFYSRISLTFSSIVGYHWSNLNWTGKDQCRGHFLPLLLFWLINKGFCSHLPPLDRGRTLAITKTMACFNEKEGVARSHFIDRDETHTKIRHSLSHLNFQLAPALFCYRAYYHEWGGEGVGMIRALKSHFVTRPLNSN